MIITLEDFQNDRQGQRFSDVVRDDRINFHIVIDFFNHPSRIRAMEEAELYHDRPAFAGVVQEFENIPEIDRFLSGEDSHGTKRFRQSIGVLIRMHMESRGWQRTGRKGSLGTRARVTPGTTTPGAYRNTSGISQWFTKSERYEKPDDTPLIRKRSVIVLGNDEFLLYIRKQYRNCRTTNDTLGRQIWIWLRNVDSAARKVQEEPCYWSSAAADFLDAQRLPRTATQFEFDRNVLPELYGYLDELGQQGSL